MKHEETLDRFFRCLLAVVDGGVQQGIVPDRQAMCRLKVVFGLDEPASYHRMQVINHREPFRV